mmetsp:Transcript_42276/g.82991  ORF Transcript_42276/g.82991 Transcript_42276/m.82991 type:complete len:244 (+) Transcript_42276:91-822(+)|eukprot:CAMPEP_0194306702 /NCGR_PEP_ID=MMETSP0171-20130528/3751_1 /TAXON_ID=218684 /ORGANISM="Corethron pennatum, Strain L29A3" /LENGTH=243 /DNA_ID=CAMNT_0039058535 /DNA_START=91 /DNA_END=822 /DNA_ORIENTATION=-
MTGTEDPTHHPATDYECRPKSKKELRAEKKAQKREEKPKSKEVIRAEKKRNTKARRQEETLKLLKVQRKENKLRQQKKRNRDRNAPGGSSSTELRIEPKRDDRTTSTESRPTSQEDRIVSKVLNEVLHGTSDDTGAVTLQLGVKYEDIVIGDGATAKNSSLLMVRYQLKGGKFGAVLDSSKGFTFRLGKGEVVRGWDIGLLGMREGGRRKLIVPPRAGYGSQDIGAGAGGILYFDITLLSIRN